LKLCVFNLATVFNRVGDLKLVCRFGVSQVAVLACLFSDDFAQ